MMVIQTPIEIRQSLLLLLEISIYSDHMETIDLTAPLCLIIGRNNSGKSSLIAKFVVVFQNHLVTVELIHCVGHNDRGVAPGAGAVVETVHKAEHTAYQPAPTREQMTKIESIMRFEFARRDMIPHARSEH